MIVANARVCRHCGERFGEAEQTQAEGDATGGIIPYKNVPALVAYYLGVFSLIPCFPIGIAALVLGIMGLRKAAAEPRVRGQVHAWIGILVGGFFGLAWLVVTLIFVALPFAAGRGR
jgi:hypothetical protein